MNNRTSPVSSRTLLALTEALENTFDASAWAALGVALDMPQLGDPETRLQESLRLRDDDYGYFIAQFLRHLQSERPGALRDIACLPKVSAWLDSNTPEAAQALGSGQHQAAPAQKSVSASEAVDQALKDARHPPGASGLAGRDQVHTALHLYLRDVCDRIGLPVADDATVAQLFKSVRNGHPELVALDQHDPRVGNVLTSLAEAVTALSRVGNVGSISAQNRESMEEAETMLAVNLVRTLFDYLRARL
jgi:hypothetical protein